MKKLGLPLVFVSMLFAVPAFADGSTQSKPTDGSAAVPLGYEYDRICNEAQKMQETRIRDLRAAIEYDKETERKLIEGAHVRESDADSKDNHARQWREHAGRVTDERKRAAFNNFATWLESEAKSDRRFARERREAAGIIGKGWREAQSAIAGHERYLADLRAQCGGG
jgi:hypothetical protein